MRFVLLGYDTIYSGRWVQTFLRNTLPVSSGWSMKVLRSFETLVSTYQLKLLILIRTSNCTRKCLPVTYHVGIEGE
jgi:hypothetical protein